MIVFPRPRPFTVVQWEGGSPTSDAYHAFEDAFPSLHMLRGFGDNDRVVVRYRDLDGFERLLTVFPYQVLVYDGTLPLVMDAKYAKVMFNMERGTT